MRSLFIFAALTIASPVQAQTFQGVATALDGDTLEMTGTVIDLAHIDAPELQQRCTIDDAKWDCGVDAGTELDSLVKGKEVTCVVASVHSSGKNEASCRTDTFDIGVEMVRRGMAVALEESPYQYLSAATVARNLGSGLWEATFSLPWIWRAANPEVAPINSKRTYDAPQAIQAEPISPQTSACLIKGNRNRRGEWIYHLPGRPYYAVTRAEEWFCSEGEARAAGYRKSRS